MRAHISLDQITNPLFSRACWSIITAAEFTAIPLVMQYWTQVVPDWACESYKFA